MNCFAGKAFVAVAAALRRDRRRRETKKRKAGEHRVGSDRVEHSPTYVENVIPDETDVILPRSTISANNVFSKKVKWVDVVKRSFERPHSLETIPILK